MQEQAGRAQNNAHGLRFRSVERCGTMGIQRRRKKRKRVATLPHGTPLDLSNKKKSATHACDSLPPSKTCASLLQQRDRHGQKVRGIGRKQHQPVAMRCTRDRGRGLRRRRCGRGSSRRNNTQTNDLPPEAVNAQSCRSCRRREKLPHRQQHEHGLTESACTPPSTTKMQRMYWYCGWLCDCVAEWGCQRNIRSVTRA